MNLSLTRKTHSFALAVLITTPFTSFLGLSLLGADLAQANFRLDCDNGMITGQLDPGSSASDRETSAASGPAFSDLTIAGTRVGSGAIEPYENTLTLQGSVNSMPFELTLATREIKDGTFIGNTLTVFKPGESEHPNRVAGQSPFVCTISKITEK